MKEGILFDLDGTLWDSSRRITVAWNEVLQRLGLSSITYEQLCSYLGKTPRGIADRMLPYLPLEERDRVLEECFAEENRQLAQYGGILYPGLEETLRLLREKYFLAIVSNCSHGYIENFLQYHKLSTYFSDYEYAGRTGLEKGENIRLVMERNGITRAFYLGDTQGDLDASDQAGIPFLFASYGFGQVNRQVPVLSAFSDLPGAAKQLLG